MESNQKRIPLWDMLKLFLIFLVIWGHCIKGFSTTNCDESTVYRIIYSFHMPLFMMISGFFPVSSMSMSFWTFLRKKFWNLLYPCLIWGAIMWILFESINSFHYGNERFSILGLLVDYYWLSNFWFLKSCFICYVLAYIGLMFNKRRYLMLPMTLFLSQFISPHFVSFMYPCFIIGIFLHKKVFICWIKRHCLLISFLFFIMLLFWNKQMWDRSHGIPSDILNADIEVWLEILYARFFRHAIGIVGSLTFIACLHCIFKNDTKSEIIHTCCDWGKYSLYIYVLQRVLLEEGLSNLICMDSVEKVIYEFIVTFFVSVLLLLFFIYVSIVMSRSSVLEKWLWGKHRKVSC